jgi:hypothetical protein
MIVYYLFVHKKSVWKRKVCIIFIRNKKFKKTQKNPFLVGFLGFFGWVFLGGFFNANPVKHLCWNLWEKNKFPDIYSWSRLKIVFIADFKSENSDMKLYWIYKKIKIADPDPGSKIYGSCRIRIPKTLLNTWCVSDGWRRRWARQWRSRSSSWPPPAQWWIRSASSWLSSPATSIRITRWSGYLARASSPQRPGSAIPPSVSHIVSGFPPCSASFYLRFLLVYLVMNSKWPRYSQGVSSSSCPPHLHFGSILLCVSCICA